VTRIDQADEPSLLVDTGSVRSSTASLGGSLLFAGGTAGIVISQPVQMTHAPMTYRLPVSRHIDGSIAHAVREIDLSPARRETDIGLFFRRHGWGDVLSAEGFVEWRYNALHAPAGPVVEAGIRLRLVF
jgi:hypothetical protein